jgi:F5/8 type C domain
MARSQDQQHLGALLALLATAYVACSAYDGSNRVSKPPQLIPDADYGGAPSVTAGASPGGAATNAGAAGSATGAAGAPSAGAAGSTVGGGANSGGANSGGANSGGANSGGASPTAGGGGTPAGGRASAGGAGAGGGSAGGTAIEQLLSQGKPATADSEETGHLAALGDDGATDTRWCAANGAAGHYWQVDLGQTYVLSKLSVSWEKAVVYQFKVDGSLDGTSFTPVLDQTQSTNAVADQTYPLSAAPSARYVRVTTTTLPNSNIWASFFEFQVYGH